MDIILVSGASARARTLSLDWRHGVVVALVVFILLMVFTLAFNYLTLKWAAAVNHPWLQAIVLADQREEAQRAQEKIQGHLNAMALKLGDLEAQVLRLDHLGDRLAGVAGLAPGAAGEGASPGAAARRRRRACARPVGRRVQRLLEGLGRRSAADRPVWCSSPLDQTSAASSSSPALPIDEAGTRRTSDTGSTRSPGSRPTTRASISRPRQARRSSRRRAARSSRRSGIASTVK